MLGNARLALAALAVLLCGGLLASGIAAASSAPSQVQASVLGPTPTPTALPCIVNTGSITNGDPTQAGIVNRLFSPSVCLPSRSCPGLADTTPRHYDAYTFMVTAGNSQCVTISVDTSSCSGNLYSVAYRGSYNP